MKSKQNPSVNAKKDPFAEREASKYASPIPSREYILELLDRRGELMRRDEIAAALNLTSEEQQEALRRRLRAMERDGQIIYTRRGFAPTDKLDLVRGRVIGHPDGFGFLVNDEGGNDLFLSAKQMSGILHGDRVVARVAGIDRRGRTEAAVVEVLERANSQIVGRFYSESGVGYVVPDNKRLHQEIMVPLEQSMQAVHGQFVVIDIIEQPTPVRKAIGRVVEILGDHMAPGMEIDVAIRSYGLPSTWPPAVAAEITQFSESVPETAKQGRQDIRSLPLVTIDGEDARDFDDAVYCESTASGWRLLVAIADVSAYVEIGSALDEEARQRGNSVYFPERVVPMLPEVLSNGLCSLNPEVDRLCMVCEMYIDKKGKIYRSRFFEAVMRSHARLTYTQVGRMLQEGDGKLRQQYTELLPALDRLYSLYKVLHKARKRRGAIDFDTTETRIVFGIDRKIERIIPVYRNHAHMLIEECMIAANVCAARFLQRHKMPTLYRVHDTPDEQKLLELRSFLGEFGVPLRGGDRPEAAHFAKVIQQIKGRKDAHLIQTVLLRAMKQAQYSPDNIGHFGLAHPSYAHFTSPIRRYPDLLVHRAIRHLLRNKTKKKFPYDQNAMQVFGEHCSMTDRRADEATRDAVNWLKCEFMLDKIGEEFTGIISAVTSFGIFVELEDIFVEGLVHVTALENDYFHFDPSGHRLIGERTSKIYRLGDLVRITVLRVDLDDRKIDFALVTEMSPLSKTKPRKSKRKAAGDSNKQRSRSKTDASKQKSGKTKSKKSAKAKKGNPKSNRKAVAESTEKSQKSNKRNKKGKKTALRKKQRSR